VRSLINANFHDENGHLAYISKKVAEFESTTAD